MFGYPACRISNKNRTKSGMPDERREVVNKVSLEI